MRDTFKELFAMNKSPLRFKNSMRSAALTLPTESSTCKYIYTYLSINLSIYLSISIYLASYVCIYLSICLAIYLSYLYIYLSIYP